MEKSMACGDHVTVEKHPFFKGGLKGTASPQIEKSPWIKNSQF